MKKIYGNIILGFGIASLCVFGVPVGQALAKIVSNYKIVYLDTDSSVIIKDTQYICNSTYNRKVLEAMAYLEAEEEKNNPKIKEPIIINVASTTDEKIN